MPLGLYHHRPRPLHRVLARMLRNLKEIRRSAGLAAPVVMQDGLVTLLPDAWGGGATAAWRMPLGDARLAVQDLERYLAHYRGCRRCADTKCAAREGAARPPESGRCLDVSTGPEPRLSRISCACCQLASAPTGERLRRR